MRIDVNPAGGARMSDKGMDVSTPTGGALGSIWVVDWSISGYTMSQSGEVEDSFSTRMLSHKGLGVDSNDSVWIGNYAAIGTRSSTGEIEKYDEDGYDVGGFQPGIGVVDGFDIDSNDCIWITTSSSVYKFDDGGSQLYSFSAPFGDNTEGGLGVDNDDSIWLIGGTTQSMYKLDQTGSLIKSVLAPATDSEGLGTDSNDCLWVSADTGQDASIFKTDSDGNTVGQYDAPGRDPKGVGVNSNDSIIISDLIPKSYNVNIESGYSSPYPVSSIHMPGANPNGLGVDQGGYTWTIDGDTNTVYGQTTSGSVVYSFAPAAYINDEAGPLGLDVDANNCIWIGGNNFGTSEVLQCNRQGSIISSFALIGDARGIGIDSSDCIWTMSRYNESIYTYDQSGTTLSAIDNPLQYGGAGLAINPDGSLWASNYQNYQMYKMDENGSIIQQLNGVGAFTKGIGYV